VDGTVWHVPNGQIQGVGNMSQHWSRGVLDVQIASDSDIDAARAAMRRVADELRHAARSIIEEPEVWGVQSLGPGAITIRLVAKTSRMSSGASAASCASASRPSSIASGSRFRPPGGLGCSRPRARRRAVSTPGALTMPLFASTHP
jgi:small-conductance mechanosensitive channel